MAQYLRCLLFVWYLLAVTVTRADRPVPFNHGFLYGRADGDSDPSDPGLQCTKFCEVSTGNSQGPRGLTRRADSPCGAQHARVSTVYDQPLLYGIDDNENATESSLAKRAFPEEINNNADAAKYVIGVINGGGNYDGFFDGTVAAVQKQRKFEGQAFQWGTGGLHGCTMVAIISKRAIFMAHYWETYSTHGEDTNSGNSRQQFIERVVKALKGEAVSNPYNPPEAFSDNDRTARNHKYIKPDGGGIDFSLFDNDGDNSVMYIMTPLKQGKAEDSEDYLYKNKYQSILGDEIKRRGRIRGCRIVITGYQRLVYKINDAGNAEKMEGHDDDWEEFNNPKNAKGMALFEYDGKDTWRLFWENKYYTGNV